MRRSYTMRFTLTIAAILGCSLIACDDGYYIKVFSCPEEKPFFNTVDNRCYSSEAAAEEVNKLINSGKEQNSGKDQGNEEFSCSEEKPFFNVVDNRCYINEAAADEANNLIPPDPADPVDPIDPDPDPEDPIETPDPVPVEPQPN